MKIGSLIRKFFSSKNGMNNNQFSKEELKKRLTPEQYRVTQQNGTERPFKSKSQPYFRLVLQYLQAWNI